MFNSRIIQNSVGFHPACLSVMLSGTGQVPFPLLVSDAVGLAETIQITSSEEPSFSIPPATLPKVLAMSGLASESSCSRLTITVSSKGQGQVTSDAGFKIGGPDPETSTCPTASGFGATVADRSSYELGPSFLAVPSDTTD